MTSKSFKKVAMGMGIFLVGGMAVKLGRRHITRLIYDFQWQKYCKACNNFMNYNELPLDQGECVSESGNIPIFTYDSQLNHITGFKIPKGYALLEITNEHGISTYAYAEKSVKCLIYVCYTVLGYFVDTEDWLNK